MVVWEMHVYEKYMSTKDVYLGDMYACERCAPIRDERLREMHTYNGYMTSS